MSDERFVVSTNTVGEIIVTEAETGNLYHYGSMSNFLGLIRLMNEQQATIQSLKEENERLKEKLNVTALELVDGGLLLIQSFTNL